MDTCGFDMPNMDHYDPFPAIIRRDLQPREAPYCELSYALPRVGPEGMLAAVWQEVPSGRWRCCKCLAQPGVMPVSRDLADVPVWLVLLLAAFVDDVAVAVRHASRGE